MSQPNKQSNFELRKQLKALMTQAQKNELKLQKMQQQELGFISANSLPELIDNILQQYRDAYELDYVSLMLIDPSYEIRHVIEFMSPGLLKLPTLIFASSHTELENVVIAQAAVKEEATPIDFQKNLFPNFKDEPYLGNCTLACKNILFPSITKNPESVAVLPLFRHNELIGSLNLASHDNARFISGIGTDLLKRLSSILAVCIENAINNEKLKLLGLTDALTGIHNRRYFMQRLEEEVVRGTREKLPVSCLFIDIDHFKSFNDLYGHSVGDEVLRYVSDIIKKQMRLSDVLARYGGEEFAVLLSNTDTVLAQEVAERIRLSIANAVLHVDSLEDDLNVTVSIGCTTMTQANNPNTTLLGESLLNSADQALYVAKDAGRNCITVAPFTEPARAQAVH
ncbi:MAG TPA: sensor domain-containing diguanylate cyclase [Gammaproteobacteria bacterium]|nr:sensor domain-containing diguanylate cyclase [Gammaproteobacteria bacterium]